MTTPVVLGIDPQKTRLGLALVEFEPPYRALWADTVSIDEADGGWRHAQVSRVLGGVENRTFQSFEVVRVGIEQVPYVGNPERFRELCEVVGVIQTKAHERWPWAPQVPLVVSSWKLAALGNGKASKAMGLQWATDALGLDVLHHDLGQDSADALGIAVAAAMVEIQERVA